MWQQLWEQFKSPQAVAAAIAALVALLAAVSTIILAVSQRRAERRQRRADRLQLQLSNLYVPLSFLRSESRHLRGMLPANDESGDRWRLVDHIEEIKESGNSERISCVTRILKIWGKIEDLLHQQGGLLVSLPPSKVYQDALAHAAQLRISWKAGNNQDSSDRFPYPETLDTQISKDIDQIRGELKKLGVFTGP